MHIFEAADVWAREARDVRYAFYSPQSIKLVAYTSEALGMQLWSECNGFLADELIVRPDGKLLTLDPMIDRIHYCLWGSCTAQKLLKQFPSQPVEIIVTALSGDFSPAHGRLQSAPTIAMHPSYQWWPRAVTGLNPGYRKTPEFHFAFPR